MTVISSSLQGTSRVSLDVLREELAAVAEGQQRKAQAQLSSELLAVGGLLTRDSALRSALSDPGTPSAARSGTVDTLLSGRISAPALALVRAAAGLRWSRPRDLADAIELLGVAAAFRAAEADGSLDRTEDELFRFGRALAAQPALRGVLQDARVEPDRRAAIVHDLLAAKASATTLALLEHAVRDPRGRHLEDVVDQLVELAAERTDQIVAEVRVPVPLEAGQERRLADALGRIYRRGVQLQVTVEPQLLGGAVITVGDEVIDGSVVAKLEQARRRLAG